MQFQPVAVTEADKAEIRKAQSNPRGRVTMSVGGPGGRATPMPPPSLGEPDWPAFKPAFRENSVRTAPDGTLWVQRYGAAGAPVVYDLFDARGALARQVSLPKRSRVVGFGPTTVYVATMNDDDLEVLGRYRRP